MFEDRKEYDRLLVELRRVCEANGIQTAAASPIELLSRIEKQFVTLKGDILRLSHRAKDPSGRWG